MRYVELEHDAGEIRTTLVVYGYEGSRGDVLGVAVIRIYWRKENEGCRARRSAVRGDAKIRYVRDNRTSEDDICRSHRIGAKSKPQPDGTVKHRPIIVRFIKYRDRRKVFGEKKKLRGSGFIFREDLTKARLDVYRRAVAMFGLKKITGN
ncbi:hypothetical protein J6590_075273 [Homalodisca vitripennis]|nr:hypothetical protein J6590_075273 [Homalodisca vitripennis]